VPPATTVIFPSGTIPANTDVISSNGTQLTGSSNFTDNASSQVAIGYSTASSSGSTGALVVTGGVGVGGAVHVTGAVVAGGNLVGGQNVVNPGGYSGAYNTFSSGTNAGSAQSFYVALDGTSSTVTYTLPAANSIGAGYSQLLFVFCLNATNTVTIQRAGSDTITGAAGAAQTSFTMSTRTGITLHSNGVSLWTYH
jgi:hypothetical protein